MKWRKCLNLWPKMSYLSFSGLIFESQNLKCLIWVFLSSNFEKQLSYLKSAPSNLSNCKILWKNKNSSNRDQKCLIWVFWQKMPYMSIFGLEFEKKYHIWNQRPWICLVSKFGATLKIRKFEIKNARFGYFWAGIWK